MTSLYLWLSENYLNASLSPRPRQTPTLHKGHMSIGSHLSIRMQLLSASNNEAEATLNKALSVVRPVPLSPINQTQLTAIECMLTAAMRCDGSARRSCSFCLRDTFSCLPASKPQQFLFCGK